MEPQTIFLLSLQLIALFSIAGALLLYLLCKVRSRNREEETLVGHTVLITSADTALGLQLSTHFAHRGCRVFAGMKDPAESLSAKLLKGWIKSKENTEVPLIGSILPLKLDVTKEDVLKDAVDAIGSYLNVGEKGEWDFTWMIFNYLFSTTLSLRISRLQEFTRSSTRVAAYSVARSRPRTR